MLLTLTVAGVGAAFGGSVPSLVHRLTGSRTGPAGPRPTRVRAPGAVLAGAIVFGLLTARLGADPALPAFIGVATVGVLLAYVDLACRRLPDPLVAGASALAATGLTGATLLTGAVPDLVRAGAAVLGCAAGYVLLALLPRSRLGFGDVKLGAVLGAPLGWLGWDAVLLGVVLPHLIMGPVALVLLLTRRVGRDTALPFGPALLTGALLATAIMA